MCPVWRPFGECFVVHQSWTLMNSDVYHMRQFTQVQAIRDAGSYHDFSVQAWLAHIPAY